MDILPACAPSSNSAVASHAMARSDDAAQLLDVQVNQITRCVPLVAPSWLLWFEILEARKAHTNQNRRHRRARHPELAGDFLSGQSALAQLDNHSRPVTRCLPRHAMRSRAAVQQASGALAAVPTNPLVAGPDGYAHALGL